MGHAGSRTAWKRGDGDGDGNGDDDGDGDGNGNGNGNGNGDDDGGDGRDRLAHRRVRPRGEVNDIAPAPSG